MRPVQRPARLHPGGPARCGGERGPGAGALRHQELRLSVPGQPHHCQSGPRPCEEVRHAVRPAHPGRHPGRRRAAEGAGPGLRLCGGAVPVRGTAPRSGHSSHGIGRRAGWHPLSLRSGGQCRRGHPGRRSRRLPCPGRGPAGPASHRGGAHPPGPPLGTRPRPRARPRLLRGEGAGEREAGPGDRRGRRPQPAHVWSSRVWQIHAGPPPALHPP